MKLTQLLLSACLALGLQAQDAHPELRAIILEAIELTKDAAPPSDKRHSQDYAAEYLSRAGYSEDAEKTVRQYLPQQPFPPHYLWKAWVVYGQQQRMDQHLATLKDPNKRVVLLNAYASFLWRLGKKEKAKQTYLEAKALLPRVTIPKVRTGANNLLTQGLKYVDDDAPMPVSTQTVPPPKRAPVPSLGQRFPITPDGFGSKKPREIQSNSLANEKLIEEIYASLRLGDTQSLDRIVSSADTPFQKALAIASVQHILNQNGLTELSEICAKAIPARDPDTKLAKAEALASAGTALFLKNALIRSRALLIEASDLADGVSQIPMGRLQVLTNIALRQYNAGFDSDGETTWRRAIQLADEFPNAPAVWANRELGTKYREDSFWVLINGAVELDQLSLARLAVTTWSQSDQKAAATLVSALLRVNEFQLALATARNITDRRLRAEELLRVVSSWLDAIKAPFF